MNLRASPRGGGGGLWGKPTGGFGGCSPHHGLGRSPEFGPEGSEASPGAEGARAGQGSLDAPPSWAHTPAGPLAREGASAAHGDRPWVRRPRQRHGAFLGAREHTRGTERAPEEGAVQASPHPLSAPRPYGSWYTPVMASDHSALIWPGGDFRLFSNRENEGRQPARGEPRTVRAGRGGRVGGPGRAQGGDGGALLRGTSLRGLTADPITAAWPRPPSCPPLGTGSPAGLLSLGRPLSCRR